MHSLILYFVSIITTIFLTIKIYINEKSQEKYLLNNKKIKNHRILENNKKTDNLDSNYFWNYLSIDDSLFDILKNWPSNMTEEEYCSVLQKQYLLSNLTEFTMVGFMIYVPKNHIEITENYSDFLKIRDFYFNINDMTDKNFFFTKGKNISSNEDILIFADYF